MTAAGATVLAHHTCSSLYQDDLYGRGVRVFNVKKDGSGNCTVCGGRRTSLVQPQTGGKKVVKK